MGYDIRNMTERKTDTHPRAATKPLHDPSLLTKIVPLMPIRGIRQQIKRLFRRALHDGHDPETKQRADSFMDLHREGARRAGFREDLLPDGAVCWVGL